MLAECVIECGGDVLIESEQNEMLLMTVRDMGNGVCRVERASWVPTGGALAGSIVVPSLPTFIADALELVAGRPLSDPQASCRYVSDGITEYLITL